MEHETDPLLVEPRRLLLELAGERSLPRLLDLAVRRLAESPRVTLARIWLIERSLDCTGCRMIAECPDRSLCLHLAASAGRSVADPSVSWTRIDGAFRRFPLGVRKVGRIGATGEAIEAPDLGEAVPDWIVRPEWVRAEGVEGFGGQPLVSRGQILGVLGVFARGRIGPDCMSWLRVIADHAAAAISTARAFEEIDSLRKKLEVENEYLKEEVEQAGTFGDLVGQSPALWAVARQIDLVAPTDSSVLVLGESGTGKELIAREIHRRSKRADHALIKVNCAAIPRELYESEFFGHAKGSFTGALRDRAGRFELADGGTLFLDEIGEIPLELQAKLLRVLQEGELERVGDERTRKVDVRLIAATNRDLRAEADAGRFRQDLYYRLSVFPVELPPLRKRLEDIPLLADHFLTLSCRKLGRPKPRLTLANVQHLQQYSWPGNIRELQHVIERSAITSTAGRLAFDLPQGEEPRPSSIPVIESSGPILTECDLRQIESDNILAALRASRGKLYGPGGAAELIGIKPTTLASRMKALGLGKHGEA
ncbi:sigma 54-interacting transcriptional regulator [Singulisphaera sp. PoT]|uniref:sigma-54-dependent Fis family transcriptional regulator n=1 Tax=Singulisphaera sp. PoT TaxID=3411797 RepID=UPI003BF5C308